MPLPAGSRIDERLSRDGDDALPAPGEAIAATRRRVHRYLRFLGCGRDHVDDLAQETMTAAVARFRDGDPPWPWIMTTARNALRMHLRRAGRNREIADLDRLDDRWREQARGDGGDALLEALRQCLQELPQRSRLAMQLRYRDGLSREEIAAHLGLGAEGCKSLFVRLRNALADCARRRIDDD